VTITRIKTDYNRFSIVGSNPTETLSSTPLNLTAVTTGSSVANWQQLVREGKQAGSEYTAVKTRITKRKARSARLISVNKFAPTVVNDRTWIGFPGPMVFQSPASTSTTDVENKALMKIHKKIRQESSHMNGWSFTGELRETINMFRHPFESMRQAVAGHLNTLSKRKRELNRLPPLKQKQAWRKVLADTWLETSFGIMPLIHDAKDIAESLGRFVEEPPRKVRIYSKSKETQRAVLYTPRQLTTSDGIYTDRSVETVWELGCRYVVGLEGNTVTNVGALNRLRQVLGFNLENFVPGLYEIMPWSWLIDYFSNLGDIIEAGTTDESRVKWIVKSVYRHGVQTETNDINAAFTFAQYPPSTYSRFQLIHSGNFCTLQQEQMVLTRTLPASLGTPVFRLEHPFEKIKKMGNLLAVLAQFSGRTFDPRMARDYSHALPKDNNRRSRFGANSLDFAN
jgi:hypothetical protein